MTHKHHSIPKSRGGTDEDWNLVELDPYTHAYEHALDFVLFEHSPRFDFRHEAWPLLPEDLKKVVLKEASNRASLRKGELSPMYGRRGEKSHWWGRKHSEKSIELFKEINSGENNPRYGSHHKNEVKEKIRESVKKHLVRCLMTGKVTTPGALSMYQKKRGIDLNLRERVYD
jgi:hypothetical protein